MDLFIYLYKYCSVIVTIYSYYNCQESGREVIGVGKNLINILTAWCIVIGKLQLGKYKLVLIK